MKDNIMENALELFKSRRSTRKYKAEGVPEEQLNMIIEAGRYAPSGGNCQSTHFIVIKNREILAELANLVQQEFAKIEITPGLYKSIVNSITLSKKGNYAFHYNAPVLIVTANQKDYGNNIADCACALENMMLMANTVNLGSCWINQLKWLNENTVILEYMKKLGMDESERVYGALAVGYPDTEDGMPNREPLVRTGNKVSIVN